MVVVTLNFGGGESGDYDGNGHMQFYCWKFMAPGSWQWHWVVVGGGRGGWQCGVVVGGIEGNYPGCHRCHRSESAIPSVYSVPGPGTSVPGPETPVPGPGTSVPGPGTSVPGPGTSVPGLGTSVPGPGTSVPGLGTSVPGPGTSVPGPGTSVPGLGTSVPGPGTSCAQWAPTQEIGTGVPLI